MMGKQGRARKQYKPSVFRDKRLYINTYLRHFIAVFMRNHDVNVPSKITDQKSYPS
jgi:hypothetical protein